MKHEYNTTETFPLNLQLRKINKRNVEPLLPLSFFSFSHTPNDSRGQKTKKEITKNKKLTERTKRKRKKGRE